MIFYGALVSSTSLTAYTAAPHALISVSDSTGVIEWVEEDVPVHALQDTLAKYGAIDAEVVELKRGEFLMPGLIDTHTVSDACADNCGRSTALTADVACAPSA